MGVNIIKRPDKTFEVSGETGRWLAVNARYPVVFEFLREDFRVMQFTRLQNDLLEIQAINRDITGELNVGDSVYFSSVNFGDGIATITSFTLTGLGNTQIVTNYVLPPSFNTNYDPLNFINLLNSRSDYVLEVEVVDSVTGDSSKAEYRPYSSGIIEFDVAPFVKKGLNIQNDYSQINIARTDISKKFYLKYTEKWGTNSVEKIDDRNYYAVSGAMQLQEKYAPNLLSFTAFNDDLPEPEKARFLTDFKNPTFWPSYPFNLHYIIETNDTFPSFQRIEESLNEQGGTEGIEGEAIPNFDRNYVNAITLGGNYSEDTCEIDFWIDSGISSVNSCSLISESDWRYLPFVLNGNFVAGVRLEINSPASLIDSIDSYPGGILLQGGSQVDTLTYDSMLGYYVPSLGTSSIPFLGSFEVQIDNIPVTTKTGDSCAPDFTQTLSSEGEFNNLPVASNVQLVASSFTPGQTISITYDYSDIDGDLENVGGTLVQIVSYATQADCDSFTNGTIIFTASGDTLPLDLPAPLGGQGSEYTIQQQDGGRYFRAKVTPAALTGASPGLPGYSPCQIIDAPPIINYTHDKQTAHNLILRGTSGQQFTIQWGDGNEDVVTGTGSRETYSHNYTLAGVNSVNVIGDRDHLFEVDLNSQQIITVDFTGFDKMQDVYLNSNPGFNSYTGPASHSGNVNNFQIQGSALTTLGLDNLIFTNSIVYCYTNSSLATLTFTGSTGTLNELRGDNNNLTGTCTIPAGLNFSTGGTNYCLFDDNPLLTQLDISNLTGDLSFLYIDSCNIQGVQDLGSINFVGAIINLYSNSGLTNYDMSSCTGTLDTLNCHSCAMSGVVYVSLPFTANAGNGIFFFLNNTSPWSFDFTGSGGSLSHLRFYQSSYTGAFNCSVYNFTDCVFTGNNSPSITSLNVVGCTGSISFFYFFECPLLSGAINLSAFSWVNAYFSVRDTAVTSVDHSGTSGSFILYRTDGADITGTHTLGTFSFNAGSTLNISNNPNMTGLSMPNVTGVIKIFYFFDSGITGTIDISNSSLDFDTVDVEISGYNNPGFTGLIHASGQTGSLVAYQVQNTQAVLQANGISSLSLQANGDFRFNDCGLSASEVDNWFNTIEAIAATGSATGDIAGGGTNTFPTSASLTARNNLITAGYTVTT